MMTGLRIPHHCKNAVCSTDFNLNFNSVCFSKSIYKVVGTSSILPGKLISDSTVPPSKPVGASSAQTGVPISNRNVRLSKTVSVSSVS